MRELVREFGGKFECVVGNENEMERFVATYVVSDSRLVLLSLMTDS